MTTSSSPWRARSTSARSAKGSAMRSVAPFVGAAQGHRPVARRDGPAGRRRRTPPPRTPGAASTPTGSCGWYAERHTGSPVNERSTSARTSACAAHPAGAPLVGAVGGEDAVRHDAVHLVAEQRQRGERATGLGDHDVLGGEHEPDAGVLAGEDLLHLLELAVQPLDRVEDRVVRHRHTRRLRQHRPQRLHHAALARGRSGPCTTRAPRGAPAAAASRRSARSRRR